MRSNLDLTLKGAEKSMQNVSDNLWMILVGSVRVFVIEGKEESLLVDTGYREDTKWLVDVLKKNKIQVSHIVITHRHRDHIGGLPILKQYFDAKTSIHQAEIASLRELQEYASTRYPYTYPDLFTQFDRFLNDKDEVIAGVEVVHSPGHTPGNISLLFGNTLIVGDSAVSSPEGKMIPPPAHYNDDPELAEESFEKLKNYNVNTIAFSHSDPLKIG